MRALAVLLMLSWVAAAACTGSPSVARDGQATDGVRDGRTDVRDPCDVNSILTVSGALSGTRQGPPASASWSASNDVGLFNITADFGAPFLAVVAFSFAGEPRPSTYADSMVAVGCGVSVSDPAVANSGWSAGKTPRGAIIRGTCSLTVTSVTTTLMTSELKQYCVHGSLRATLPAQTGTMFTSAGIVDLSGAF